MPGRPSSPCCLLSGSAWLAGADPTYPGDTAYGAPIGTGLFIVIAWLAVFLVQLVTAPPRLYARLDAELLALTRRLFAPSMRSIAALPVIALPGPGSTPVPLLPVDPQPDLQSEPDPVVSPLTPAAARTALPPIDVRLHDQVHETTPVDTTGDRLPASRTYTARITNRSAKTVRRCQLFFCYPVHIKVVSGPFDLVPGEHRDLPALRVVDEADDPYALLYFLDAETWRVAAGQAAWLPEPGRFKVKVLSANAPAAALDVKAVAQRQHTARLDAGRSDRAGQRHRRQAASR